MGCSLPSPRCGSGLLWADGLWGLVPWVQDPPGPDSCPCLPHVGLHLVTPRGHSSPKDSAGCESWRGLEPQGPAELGSCTHMAYAHRRRITITHGVVLGVPCAVSTREPAPPTEEPENPRRPGLWGCSSQPCTATPGCGGGTHTSVRPEGEQGSPDWGGGPRLGRAPGAAFPLGLHFLVSTLGRAYGSGPPGPPSKHPAQAGGFP